MYIINHMYDMYDDMYELQQWLVWYWFNYINTCTKHHSQSDVQIQSPPSTPPPKKKRERAEIDCVEKSLNVPTYSYWAEPWRPGLCSGPLSFIVPWRLTTVPGCFLSGGENEQVCYICKTPYLKKKKRLFLSVWEMFYFKFQLEQD